MPPARPSRSPMRRPGRRPERRTEPPPAAGRARPALRVQIAALGEGLVSPNLAFADPGQRMLRVRRFELAGQPVTVEHAVGDQPRRVAIADVGDGLDVVVRPLALPPPELG